MALHDWLLAEQLNVYQIALLSAGYDPGELEDYYHRDWPKQVKIDTAAFVSTIKSAVLTGKLNCKQEYMSDDFDRGLDWSASLIEVEGYSRWLKERSHQDKFFNCDFFEPAESDLDRLLKPSGEFFPPKLAAAVKAWLAVTSNPTALNGKPPKRALEFWLRTHAKEFGLISKDGKPNEQGIEEVCKVANWKPQGGASRTPIPTPPSTEPTHPLPERGSRVVKEAPTSFARDVLDEEIPF